MLFSELQRTIYIDGKKYWPSSGTEMKISPSKSPGIWINGVLVDKNSLYPHSFLGARFLVVKDRSGRIVAEVVEHLLSAVYGVGIKDISIYAPKTIPNTGPGIEEIYKILKSESVEKGSGRNDAISSHYELTSHDKSCKLIVKPFNCLSLYIERKSDPEIGIDTSIDILDVYKLMESSIVARSARPIARLTNPLSNAIVKLNRRFGGEGINEENYLFRQRRTKTEELRQNMRAPFQNDANEHLAHTALSDFFGELHTSFPNGVNGRFEFYGRNNHFTRMELLAKLLKLRELEQSVR